MKTTKNRVNKLKDEIIQSLIKNHLPQGSGIDCEWELTRLKNGKIILENSIHCMNDAGCYDGYQDFKIIIDPKNLEDFTLQFTGKRKERYIDIWRSYLEDLIYESISEWRDELCAAAQE